jgi:hypothetical protein
MIYKRQRLVTRLRGVALAIGDQCLLLRIDRALEGCGYT